MKNYPKINWKKPTLSVLVLLILVGCAGPDPQKFFGSSTKASLEIYMDSGTSVQLEETKDPAKIQQFSSFISKEKTKEFTCGYDGRIVFTRKGTEYVVNFKLDEDCRHFAYIIGESLYCREITDEGMQYIEDRITEAL